MCLLCLKVVILYIRDKQFIRLAFAFTDGSVDQLRDVNRTKSKNCDGLPSMVYTWMMKL